MELAIMYDDIQILYLTAVKDEDTIMFVVKYNESVYNCTLYTDDQKIINESTHVKLQNTDAVYQKILTTLNKFIDKKASSFYLLGCFDNRPMRSKAARDIYDCAKEFI